MPDFAGTIKSNLRRATTSWEDEVMTSPRDQAMLDAAQLETAEPSKHSQLLEEQQRLFEEAVESSKRQRWFGQERWQGKENEEMRMVRLMHPHSIFAALRRAGVSAEIESPLMSVWEVDGRGNKVERRVVRNTARLWLKEESRVGLVGVMGWVRDEDTHQPRLQQITTLQYPYGPEWSLFHFNKYGVILNEKYRGWRTAMLQLIFADVVTEAEVDRAFGRPVENAASAFYRQQLQQRRTRKLGFTA